MKSLYHTVACDRNAEKEVAYFDAADSGRGVELVLHSGPFPGYSDIAVRLGWTPAVKVKRRSVG